MSLPPLLKIIPYAYIHVYGGCLQAISVRTGLVTAPGLYTRGPIEIPTEITFGSEAQRGVQTGAD